MANASEFDDVLAAFMSWWFVHHNDAQYFNEVMQLSPTAASLASSMAVALPVGATPVFFQND